MAPINWWQQAVVYQIYPRSFCDGNGDGIGDLVGITSKVPYLKALGVDAVWLTPFYPSPLNDGGCEFNFAGPHAVLVRLVDVPDDVADYRNVDPRIGSLDDFDTMVATMNDANIKVIVDIVPNHTSSDHAWFKEALKSSKGSEARARYHFRDGKYNDQVITPGS
jgi:alpha-glucosidase